MGDSVNLRNLKDKSSWPSKAYHKILGHKDVWQEEEGQDSHSWNVKLRCRTNLLRYRLGKQRKVDEQTPFKYYDGVMSPESKASRNKSYAEIDKMVVALLEKGYRIVKSSAEGLTPVGDFALGKPMPQNVGEATASNLFWEQKFNEKEFLALYDYFGRYQNNFPDYFSKKGAFAAYAKDHDIWVLEEVATNRPVGFSTFCWDDSKESRATYNTPEGQRVLYHDTVALDARLQGKGIGLKFLDIMDAYYLQTFGPGNINYALCTGDINTNDQGMLSKGLHEKRGFGNWVIGQSPLKKWVDRYVNGIKKQYKGQTPSLPPMMKDSYHGIE